MSRVGLSPVEVPDGVTIEFAGRVMTAKGKLGALSLEFVEEVDPTMDVCTFKQLSLTLGS